MTKAWGDGGGGVVTFRTSGSGRRGRMGGGFYHNSRRDGIEKMDEILFALQRIQVLKIVDDGE